MSGSTIQESVFTGCWEPTTPAQRHMMYMIHFTDSIRREWAVSPTAIHVIRRNPMYIGYAALKIASAHGMDGCDRFEKDMQSFVSETMYLDPHTWAYTAWLELNVLLSRWFEPYSGKAWSEHVAKIIRGEIEVIPYTEPVSAEPGTDKAVAA